MGDGDNRGNEAGWRVLRRERLLDNRWLRVDVEDVALPDGHRIDGYYVIHEPDWGMVFAVTDDRRVVLVRQYKHGIGRVTVELPAGYLEAGDGSPEEAIRRELREETGYEPAEIRKLADIICSPTRSSQMGHLFLATGCRRAGDQSLDPAERIEVVLAPLADLPTLVRDGVIAVESSVAGVFHGLEALRAK
jgi:8-oxo-dGTP pyrophosphatase MutT (NUDIX family)